MQRMVTLSEMEEKELLITASQRAESGCKIGSIVTDTNLLV